MRNEEPENQPTSSHKRLSPSLDHLALFVKAAELLHPTQNAGSQSRLTTGGAAGRITSPRQLASAVGGYSIQAVYNCLNTLEEEFQISITKQNSTTEVLELTNAGKELQAYALGVLRVHAERPRPTSKERISFLIGTTNRNLVFVLPPVVKRFFQKSTSVPLDLQLKEFDSVTEMLLALKYGHIHAGVGTILPGLPVPDGLTCESFIDQVSVRLIVRKDTKGKRWPSQIKLRDVKEQTFCMIESDREGILKHILKEISASNQIVTTNYSSVVALCEAGMGVGFVSLLPGERRLPKSIQVMDIEEVEIPSRKMALWIRSADDILSQNVKDLIELFRAAIHDEYSQQNDRG